MLTDGGIRTPFLAAWPGTLPAGKTYEPMVSALDVAATAVAIAGLPAAPELDGVNLIPFVRGEKSGVPHDYLFWRWRSQAAVHDGRWKLILLGPTQRYLFDTAAPDGETRNLAAQHPDIAARLLARLQAWDATLQPPGLPTETNPQDQIFFSTHVEKTLTPPAADPAAPQAKKNANNERFLSGPRFGRDRRRLARSHRAYRGRSSPPTQSPLHPRRRSRVGRHDSEPPQRVLRDAQPPAPRVARPAFHAGIFRQSTLLADACEHSHRPLPRAHRHHRAGLPPPAGHLRKGHGETGRTHRARPRRAEHHTPRNALPHARGIVQDGRLRHGPLR